MAKHDQTVLKFLNQNSDRAPTLIDMMTKMKISVSDITDSLTDLLAQGIIGKRTNDQGMESWFVMTKSAMPNPPMANPAPVSEAPEAAPKPVEPNPEPKPIAPPEPKFEPKIEPKLESEPKPEPKMDSLSESRPVSTESLLNQPQNLQTSPMFYPPIQSKGIGFGTLLIGLVITAGLSIWLGTRLANQQIQTATKDFVDQKSFVDIGNSFLEFEEKSKADVSALKVEVKSLHAQVDSLRVIADSLQASLEAAQTEKSAAKNKKAKTSKRR
jgi:hypothetical protein